MAALAVLLLHNLWIRPWMLDDSFISFRYADNLAAGHGPVYNIGRRVEGYTCFFWVLLLSLGRRAGFDTARASVFLGSLFAAGSVILAFLAYRFSKRFTPTNSAVAALFLGTCGVFTPWASSGMEVTLFTFLILLAVLITLRLQENPGGAVWAPAGLIYVLVALARPEGALVSGILILQLFLNAGTRIMALKALLVFCVIYLPYFYWRWNYYGHLFPNTFYAKVGSTGNQVLRGLRYAAGFVIVVLPLVLLCIIGLRKTVGLRQIFCLIALYTLYVILVGGDIMPAFRFFTPVLPLMCLLAAVAAENPAERRRTVLVTVLVVVFNLLQIRYSGSIHDHILEDTVAIDGKEAGVWLREHVPSDCVLATNTAGSVPYYSKLQTIDMLGLNDEHIAHRQIPWIGTGPAGHEKGDGAYVLSQKPDIIQFGSSLGDSQPRFLSDQELWRIPQFHREYEMRLHLLPSGKSLILFERRQ